MKKSNDFQISKVQFSFRVLLYFCLTFCQFQPGVAYKSVSYEKKQCRCETIQVFVLFTIQGKSKILLPFFFLIVQKRHTHATTDNACDKHQNLTRRLKRQTIVHFFESAQGLGRLMMMMSTSFIF